MQQGMTIPQRDVHLQHQASLVLPPMLCKTCGVIEVPVLGPGTGPHVAAWCAGCHGFLQWLPKNLI